MRVVGTIRQCKSRDGSLHDRGEVDQQRHRLVRQYGKVELPQGVSCTTPLRQRLAVRFGSVQLRIEQHCGSSDRRGLSKQKLAGEAYQWA